MVTKADFTNLESRVDYIESFLHISKPVPPLVTPITIVIEQELHKENISWEMLDRNLFYRHLEESDYHIFVRIFLHGIENVVSKISSHSGLGYDEYLYVQPFYNVLIIKHSDLGSINEHLWPKMNTIKTANIHMYSDKHKHVSLFFGYSNENAELKEDDNLFFTGRDNGIFFIINDKMNHIVENYINRNTSKFEKITSGLGEGFIDIYKATNLGKKNVVLKIISAQQQQKQQKNPTGPKVPAKSNDNWGGEKM